MKCPQCKNELIPNDALGTFTCTTCKTDLYNTKATFIVEAEGESRVESNPSGNSPPTHTDQSDLNLSPPVHDIVNLPPPPMSPLITTPALATPTPPPPSFQPDNSAEGVHINPPIPSTSDLRSENTAPPLPAKTDAEDVPPFEPIQDSGATIDVPPVNEETQIPMAKLAKPGSENLLPPVSAPTLPPTASDSKQDRPKEPKQLDSDVNEISIPSGDGGYVKIVENITTIQYGGEKVEVYNVSHEERDKARKFRSTLVFAFCVIFLAGVLLILRKFL